MIDKELDSSGEVVVLEDRAYVAEFGSWLCHSWKFLLLCSYYHCDEYLMNFHHA